MNPIASLFTEANNECINDAELVTNGTCRAIAYYFEMSNDTFVALIGIGNHGWKHVQKKRSDPTQTFEMMIFGEVLPATDKQDKFLDEEIRAKVIGSLSFTSDRFGDRTVFLSCVKDNSLPKGKAILRRKLLK